MERLIKDGRVILDGTEPLYAKEKRVFEKLEKLETLEEKLGSDLSVLFQGELSTHDGFMCIDDESKVYFCGDAYYGNYSKEEWLTLIQQMIAIYTELK